MMTYLMGPDIDEVEAMAIYGSEVGIPGFI